MWIFTRYGFFSVTVSKEDRTKMQIRARAKQDLENLLDFTGRYGIHLHIKFGDIIETPKADYRYRLIVDRERWPDLAHALAGDVDYSNFKEQVKDDARHRLYEDVWRTMLGLQHQEQEDLYNAAFSGTRADLWAAWDAAGDGHQDRDDPTSPFYDSGRSIIDSHHLDHDSDFDLED